MARRRPSALVVFLFACALLGGAAGCKQGLGDRCEQNSDCSSGFCAGGMGAVSRGGNGVCSEINTGTGTGGSSGVDAAGGQGGSNADAADDAPADAAEAE
jgi:hypothetical protein